MGRPTDQKRRHAMPLRATQESSGVSQEAEKIRGKWARTFIMVSAGGKKRQGRVNRLRID